MPPLAGEGDDVVDDDEVAGEVLLGDDAQLVLEPLARLAPRGGRRRTSRRSRARRAPAATSRRCGPRGSAAWAGRGRPCAGRRPARRRAVTLRATAPGWARQRGGRLGAAAQVGRARQVEPAVEVGQAAAGAHRRHRRGQPVLPRGGVVDVAGRDDVEAVDGGEPGERGVGRVGAGARRELDEHVLEPEQRGQPVERLGRRRARHRSPAPAGPRPCGSRSAPPSGRARARPARRGRRPDGPSRRRAGARRSSPRRAGGSPRPRAPAPAGGCPRGRARRSAARSGPRDSSAPKTVGRS